VDVFFSMLGLGYRIAFYMYRGIGMGMTQARK